MERIKLNEHFTYKKLIRFVLPSILMMIFVSVYGIVDGFFVSNFVGDTQFAALNLIFPLIMILGAFGFMIGTGGNAIVSKTLGEGDEKRANEIFSMLVYATIVMGAILAIIGFLLAKPVATALAQREVSLSEVERAELIRYSTMYARVILSALPAFMLQNVFQGFFVTAEKPRLGLYVTLVAGFGNMIFDAVFIVGFGWGLMGAALATAFNQLFGGIFPLFYFGRKNDSLLKLCKARFDGKIFLRTCANGFSELIANVSLSVIGFIYNVQLMSIVGIDGVSAYGILQYIGFIFVAVFIGYSVGMAPIVGYHFGARNDKELNNVYKKSLLMIACVSVLMTVVCVVFAKQFASIFVGHNPALLEMTAHGLRVNGLQYLFCGFNIFASAFFTALGSGSISFGLSFPRLFVFQAICVLLLPTFWAIDGIWLSLVFAEGIAIFITFAALHIFRKKFHYA